MKKELVIHFSFLFAFFIFVSVFRDWFSFRYLPFWLGGILGTLIIDLDHLIYVYFLRPEAEVSQQASNLLQRREIIKTFELLSSTRYERGSLIFHTALFQLLFIVFTLLIVSSSGSILGMGLVLSAYLHLYIDQLIDYLDTGKIDNWIKDLPIKLDEKQTAGYLAAVGILLLIFGFFF